MCLCQCGELPASEPADRGSHTAFARWGKVMQSVSQPPHAMSAWLLLWKHGGDIETCSAVNRDTGFLLSCFRTAGVASIPGLASRERPSPATSAWLYIKTPTWTSLLPRNYGR